MFQVTEVGRLLMAISNLAEQCYLPEYGPLEKMNALTMMNMVKVFTCRMSWLLASIFSLPKSWLTISFRSTFWTRQTRRGERGGWWSWGVWWQAQPPRQTKERGGQWEALEVKHKSKVQVKSAEGVRYLVDVVVWAFITVLSLMVCWEWRFVLEVGRRTLNHFVANEVLPKPWEKKSRRRT